MSLKARIQEDVKSAMRAGNKSRLSTLRMLTAAIKQQEVDRREDVSDMDILALVDKMIKQRREAAEQYRKGARQELAAKEESEIEVLRDYLPAPLSSAEIDELIAQTIDATGAQSAKDLGKVMSALKPQVQGRADMAEVSARVKARLTA